MSDKIKIKKVEGGGAGFMLEGCYFIPNEEGTYNFYDKDPNPNNPLATGVKNGSTFAFNLMEDSNVPWAIHILIIGEEIVSHGEWASGKSPVSKAFDESSGSFQAQAGGTPDPEEAAASANA